MRRRAPLLALGFTLIAVGIIAVTPLPVSGPTAAGLSSADLIGILAVVVSMFGLLLTAIGVLVLGKFSTLNDRIDELKSDYRTDLAAVWRELGLIRSRLWPGDPYPPQGPRPPPDVVRGPTYPPPDD